MKKTAALDAIEALKAPLANSMGTLSDHLRWQQLLASVTQELQEALAMVQMQMIKLDRAAAEPDVKTNGDTADEAGS